MNYLFLQSPIGGLELSEEDGALTEIAFVRETMHASSCTDVLLETQRQLQEYFAGERKQFTIPCKLIGTAFERSCWEAIYSVPYGETATYGQIAKAVGRDKAFRAVGSAMHKNPIPILYPCHRIIGSNGLLTGYAGGLDIKRYLLTLEGVLQKGSSI